MKYFTNRSQLARMDFHTKLIMTFFLVLMLVATGVSILMSYQRTNLTSAGAAEYYQGADERMVFAKEIPELMETSHYHLFMMPLVFVTTGHLFLLSAWGRRSKTFVISPLRRGSVRRAGAAQLCLAGHHHVALHSCADLRDVVSAGGSEHANRLIAGST